MDRERGSEREFAATRKKHPGVESRTTNLGHRGLDRVRARGADGLPRAVSLSVIAPTCTGSGPSCARGRGSGAGAPPGGLPLPAKRGVPDRPKGAFRTGRRGRKGRPCARDGCTWNIPCTKGSAIPPEGPLDGVRASGSGENRSPAAPKPGVFWWTLLTFLCVYGFFVGS